MAFFDLQNRNPERAYDDHEELRKLVAASDPHVAAAYFSADYVDRYDNDHRKHENQTDIAYPDNDPTESIADFL
jgi:hypothetical protein